MAAGARVELAHRGISPARRLSGPVPYRWAIPPQMKNPQEAAASWGLDDLLDLDQVEHASGPWPGE
jgi:hypothetical protein